MLHPALTGVDFAPPITVVSRLHESVVRRDTGKTETPAGLRDGLLFAWSPKCVETIIACRRKCRLR